MTTAGIAQAVTRSAPLALVLSGWTFNVPIFAAVIVGNSIRLASGVELGDALG